MCDRRPGDAGFPHACVLLVGWEGHARTGLTWPGCNPEDEGPLLPLHRCMIDNNVQG